eukprot:6211781-Pleurochrysis_carterae.AAC.3
MTTELLHTRFNHRRAEVIKLLPKCTRDAPTLRTTLARNIACEEYLHANSDAVHSNAHMSVAKSAGELVSYDMLAAPRKADAFSTIKHYIGYCNSHNLTIRRVHADNAGDLTFIQIHELLLEQGARLTNISPHVPIRQNGACERQSYGAQLPGIYGQN